MSEFRIRSCSYYSLMTSLDYNSDGLFRHPQAVTLGWGHVSHLERVESRDPWTEFSMSENFERLRSTRFSSFTSRGNQATFLMRMEINDPRF